MTDRRETATLADLRQSKGLTRAMLAERLGMPPNTFASIESGRRALQPAVARAIAAELDITAEEIQAAHQRGIDAQAG
ncbi:MAG TPA: helix-turn-helix transcriptional regulator [Acidimicrobiales bacterium]